MTWRDLILVCSVCGDKFNPEYEYQHACCACIEDEEGEMIMSDGTYERPVTVKKLEDSYVVADQETGSAVSALFPSYELADTERDRLESESDRSGNGVRLTVREATTFDLHRCGLHASHNRRGGRNRD